VPSLANKLIHNCLTVYLHIWRQIHHYK